MKRGAEDQEQRHERQHVAGKIGKRLERGRLVDGVPDDRERRDQNERHAPLPRGDEGRREAEEAESQKRRADAGPQAFAKMKQAPGDLRR